MTNHLWHAPPAALTLHEQEVHIWLANLDATAHDSPEETLSRGEIILANRYAHACDRRHFIAARAILRRLLSIYTGAPAGAIDIRYNPNGKPHLQGNQEARTLEFSLSHSENIALYAFCWNHCVGVDIERIRNTGDIGPLARTVLAASEHSVFQVCPDIHKTQLLYRYWTCKEAPIKAAGTTLVEIRRIAIPLEAQKPSGWIQINNGTVSGLWDLREIAPLPGYTAALATQSANNSTVLGSDLHMTEMRRAILCFALPQA